MVKFSRSKSHTDASQSCKSGKTISLHQLAKQKRRQQRKVEKQLAQQQQTTQFNDQTSNSVALTGVTLSLPSSQSELLKLAFLEWTLSHSSLSSHELWERFLNDWSSIAEYELPVNTHRPDTLYSYVKALRNGGNLHLTRKDVKSMRCKLGSELKGHQTLLSYYLEHIEQQRLEQESLYSSTSTLLMPKAEFERQQEKLQQQSKTNEYKVQREINKSTLQSDCSNSSSFSPDLVSSNPFAILNS